MSRMKSLLTTLVMAATLIVALVPGGLRPALAQDGGEVPPVTVEITGTVEKHPVRPDHRGRLHRPRP